MASTTDDIIIKVRMDLNDLKKDQATLQKVLKANPTDVNNKNLAVFQQMTADKTKELNKLLNEGASKFPGYALSIMFFGMAMERTFQGITKTALSTFQDVSHSIMFNVTAMDQLNGSFTYLQYSIGSALEPVIAYLVPIIQTVADWVSDNEGLVRGIIVIGTTLGAIFTIGGGGILALNGFKNLKTELLAVNEVESGGFLAGLTVSSPWVIAIAAAALAMGIFVTQVEKNPMFKDDFESKIVTPATNGLGAIKKSFNDLWDSLDGSGALDTVLGELYFFGGVAVYGLAGGIVTLAYAFASLAEAISAVGNALQGKFKDAGKNLTSMAEDFKLLISAQTTAATEMLTMTQDVMVGGLGLQGQLDARTTRLTADKLANGGSPDRGNSTGNPGGTVYYINIDTIQTNDTMPDVVAAAQRYSGQIIPGR